MDFKYPTSDVANGTMIAQGDDRGVFAEFHDMPVKNEYLSEQEGRPVYQNTTMLKIIYPGNRNTVYDQPVKMQDDANGPSDIKRFPAQWRAFLAQKEQVPDGTPLEHYPPFSKSRVMELKSQHIHTVEQFIALPQTANLGMGWQKEQELAKNWLDNARGGSIVSRLTSENERLKQDVEMLKRQVSQLASQGLNKNADTNTPTVFRRRGPRPKVDQPQELAKGA